MKILFIGAGNMAQAIISGIIKKNVVKNEDVFIYEINRDTEQKVIASYSINSFDQKKEKISNFDIIILAVKPQVFNGFNADQKMVELFKNLRNNSVIVSIMAGIKIKKLEEFFGTDKSIIRIMPNTPALVLQAMSVISASTKTNEEDINKVKVIFESIGKVEIMEEKYLDAVTGLSGSGPAYVFTFIEALVQGGVLCGLSRQIAQNLVVQTIIGSCSMIDGTKNIEDLKYMVTSPAGTTIEGLSVLEKAGFRSGIIEAVRAATNRSRELST
jgi:pyrroline-5-carboxylate reductase